MAAVTVQSDFGAQENKICHCFHSSPSIYLEVMGLDAMIFIFWMLSFKPTFYSPLSPSSRDSLIPLHFLPLEWYHLHIWGCWHFSWQSWFQLVSHPAQQFTWCTLHIKETDNIQPWCTPFPILKQSIVPCTVLAIESWPIYRFHRRQVRWSGTPISWRIFQFAVIHTVKCFCIVNEAEIDAFLEFPAFSMIWQNLPIWSLVPLPFLSPACTYRNSWFMYC